MRGAVSIIEFLKLITRPMPARLAAVVCAVKIALQLLGYDFGVDRQVSEPLKDSDGRRADHPIHQGPRHGLLDTPGLIGSAALSRYLLRERVKILILCGNDIVLLAQVRGRQPDKLRRGFHT
jgi:hypothetical protein